MHVFASDSNTPTEIFQQWRSSCAFPVPLAIDVIISMLTVNNSCTFPTVWLGAESRVQLRQQTASRAHSRGHHSAEVRLYHVDVHILWITFSLNQSRWSVTRVVGARVQFWE